RDPPIRFRASIPTSWIELTIREGRNRQVRHMTAAVGTPTLRLIRTGIGPLKGKELEPGAFRPLSREELESLAAGFRLSKGRKKMPVRHRAQEVEIRRTGD
ncbi:MAG TPA: pseudouridine synthase, partial [Chroococcales cyanobacterium]